MNAVLIIKFPLITGKRKLCECDRACGGKSKKLCLFWTPIYFSVLTIYRINIALKKGL